VAGNGKQYINQLTDITVKISTRLACRYIEVGLKMHVFLSMSCQKGLFVATR
jgi:hypothetical protein